MEEIVDSELTMSKDGSDANFRVFRKDGQQITVLDIIEELDYLLKSLKRTQKEIERGSPVQ